MKVKKKVFCILLSLVMVIAMMPVTAFAEESGVQQLIDKIESFADDVEKSEVGRYIDTVQKAGDAVLTVITVAQAIDSLAKDVDKEIDAKTSVVTVTAGENGKVNRSLPRTVSNGTTISVDGNKLKIGLLTTVTATPSKNCEFDGWAGVPVGGKVTSDCTITAQFKKKRFEVSFNVVNIGIAPLSQTVSYGEKVYKPFDPAAPGYEFGGWYKDANYTTAWNFDTDTVTKGITLYAKWSEVPYQEPVEAQVAAEDIETTIGEFVLRCSTEKISKGIEVKAKVIEGDIVTVLDSNYTITYDFYRSTKPSEGYAYMFSSSKGTYKNTSVKKGKKYYYKAVAIIEDADGNAVASTVLSNCKYGSRTF